MKSSPQPAHGCPAAAPSDSPPWIDQPYQAMTPDKMGALQAIRLRQYFEGEPSSSSAAVKRLRFNARFIVVCLLLNKKEVS